MPLEENTENIDTNVSVGGQQQTRRPNSILYDAEKTKSHRNVVSAFCVGRHARQVLQLLFSGGHSSKIIASLILLKLLHVHYNQYISMKLGWGARTVLDYSNVKNIEDLVSLRKRLDSLCFPEMEHVCECPDPLTPADRLGRRHWEQVTRENKERAIKYKGTLDVVFYGDSITEAWLGTSLGLPHEKKKYNQEVFKSLFNVEGGGKYNALALGVSGDLTTSLLWRLQNGELPESIHPRVFWILIGTNDLGNKWCSPDATLIGIIRVVEEIKQKRPGSLIVINSLFPRSWHPKGKVWEGRQKANKIFLPQLWTSIIDINHYLKLYSENQENVHFFDGNDIFFSNQFENVWQKDLMINKDLMYDYLHPSFAGYEIWGKRIVQELDRLIGR
mmetsp:Transcript_16481/g.31238  ORF Transcript_16481/g.31238 Transcript_16481/m.31238 type:complete len:388 (-) Transcript_16481:29-1192(-)